MFGHISESIKILLAKQEVEGTFGPFRVFLGI
jgi:hypothetical protein